MQYLDATWSMAWYALLMAFNFFAPNPTEHILAYSIPVIVITLKRNLRWGILTSSVGTLAAVLSGAIAGHLSIGISLAEEGLFSFAQLSAIALGVSLGKKSHQKRSASIGK